MRTLARNMAFLIKSIALGKEKFGLPKKRHINLHILLNNITLKQNKTN